MTGTVKALEWEQPDGPHGKAWLGHGFDMCQYYIRFDEKSASYWLPGDAPYSDDDDSAQEFQTLDVAKAAAQADYERRVLSALTASASEPATLVGWQRKHPTEGWVMVQESDIPHYMRQGQETRAIYASPVPASEPEPVAANQFADAIYVASKVKHADRWQQIASVHPLSSSWIYEAGVGETADFHDLWQRCLSEASMSKALVAYREPGEVLKGAWAEIGAALAHGVPVHAVGLEEFSIAKYRGIIHHATLEEAVKAALSEPRRTLANPVPTPDGAVEALRKCIAAMTAARKWFHDADEAKLLDEAIAQSSAALSHPADGWRDIESAPTGWGNFFFVRPCGMHHSGKPFLPTIVQFVDGEFYTPENELDPVYFGQNEPEDSPLKSTLEWFPIPQGWITTAPAAKAEGE